MNLGQDSINHLSFPSPHSNKGHENIVGTSVSSALYPTVLKSSGYFLHSKVLNLAQREIWLLPLPSEK